ncbi:unnamed protein product [Prorocentrum cordatum]|uniref:Uncharacterized protein n=1 Tax=Prorocentrum cordatum TaxID=2364126 RepID=A0ABN9UR43_9DINO|nr:unnamed protein product [Polarella glacialis]
MAAGAFGRALARHAAHPQPWLPAHGDPTDGGAVAAEHGGGPIGCYASGCGLAICYASGCGHIVCYASGCGPTICYASGCGTVVCYANGCGTVECYACGCGPKAREGSQVQGETPDPVQKRKAAKAVSAGVPVEPSAKKKAKTSDREAHGEPAGSTADGGVATAKEKKKLEAKETRKATSDAQAQVSLFSQVVMNADMLEFTIGTDPAWEWAKEHKKFVAMKNARAQLKAKELLTTKMQDVKTKYGDAYFTEQIQKIPSIISGPIAKLQDCLDKLNNIHALNASDDDQE